MRKMICALLGCHMWVAGSSEPLLLPVVTGRLMIVPKAELPRYEVVPDGMVRVWAYNQDSENWAQRGCPILDMGRVQDRFPRYLSYAWLANLSENSLFVFEKNNRQFMLTCANLGTRYGDLPFEKQLQFYAVLNKFAPKS